MRLAALLVVLSACGPAPVTSDTDPDTDTDTDTDTQVDTDTDTQVDEDLDDDGYRGTAFGGDDCNDADPTVHPGATETWYDGIDQDCDGASDYDADGDGHDAQAWGGDDCDDADPTRIRCGTSLADYAPAGALVEITTIATNLSGVTWRASTGTWLAIRDSARRVHELDASLAQVREIGLLNVPFSDLEDIAWLGDDAFAIVAENGTMLVGDIPDDGATSLDVSGFQVVTYAPLPASNKGGEGVAWDAATETFWVCNEKSPMAVFRFTRPAADAEAHYASDLEVTEPFDAEVALGGTITDISSCLFDPRSGRLLVLSHESHILLDVDPSDGTIAGSLAIADLAKPEGVALNDAGDLLIVGEPNEARLYTIPSR